MVEKLNPLYELLKEETPIRITSELKGRLDWVKKALSDSCESALKRPIPEKQLVLRTDTSLGSAGSAQIVEYNSDQK